MFYSIANLRAIAVSEIPEPWNWKPASPPPYDDKDAYVSWKMCFQTEHAFISGYEGITAEVRVSDDNVPARLHALIVDYDGKLPDNPAKFVKEKPGGPFMPNYMVRTANGNGRLIWVFERPLLLVNKQQTKEFLKTAARQLRLDRWLPGLDTEAFANANQYYEIGRGWEPIKPGASIPAGILESWLVQSSAGLAFDESKQMAYTVPIESLAKETEERFPGRWKGPFILGARGVRFWDASADNETAAVVREDGMMCFTGGQAFVPWRQIFGAKFLQQFERDYVAGVIEDSVYDGREFWTREDGVWQSQCKADFTQSLRVRGHTDKRSRNQTASEIDIIEHTIKRTRRISRALPFLFFPPEPLFYKGKYYLNTSKVKPIAPADPIPGRAMTFADGVQLFPLIHKLLCTMFVEKENPEIVDEQLHGFLAWLKYFYVNSLNQTPKPGHVVVLAGPSGKGKTLLNRRIVGGLMGDSADASDHLVSGDQWTERILESPLMCVDDSMAVSDHKAMMQFTFRLKKYAANPEKVYNEKFKSSGEVPWFGRIIVTCNLDAESLRILPDMDLNTNDKISLFKASDHVIDFPDFESTAKAIKQQLPFFARFLLDWPLPPEWVGSERFGVKPYHHPELFDESREHGLGIVIELLHGFLKAFREAEPGRDHWSGTTTQLHQDLSVFAPDVIRDIKPVQLGMALGKLEKNGYNLLRWKDRVQRVSIWKIGFDIHSDDVKKTAAHPRKPEDEQ